MAESTKSVADVKQSVSQHVQEVNDAVSNTARDLGLLTKELIQKESIVVQSFKEHAAQDLKVVQDSYAEKEEKVLKLLRSSKSSDGVNDPTSDGYSENFSNDYERILQENIGRLKEIAKEDFKASNSNAQKLMEETKNKLHDFISKAFKESASKKDFANTTGAIFANVNKKIRGDLLSKSHKAERTTSILSPDIANIFVHPMNKPPEEIEAERLLQQLFENELLEFNAQIKRDFQDMHLQMAKHVDDTKANLNETLQSATKKIPKVDLSKASETSSFSNLPSKSTVEKNVNDLLNKAGEDFKDVRVSMLSDVARNKQRINNSAMYYAEKMLGKEFLGRQEDED